MPGETKARIRLALRFRISEGRGSAAYLAPISQPLIHLSLNLFQLFRNLKLFRGKQVRGSCRRANFLLRFQKIPWSFLMGKPNVNGRELF